MPAGSIYEERSRRPAVHECRSDVRGVAHGVHEGCPSPLPLRGTPGPDLGSVLLLRHITMAPIITSGIRTSMPASRTIEAESRCGARGEVAWSTMPAANAITTITIIASLPRCRSHQHSQQLPVNGSTVSPLDSLICAMADQHADLVDVANDDHNPTSSTTSSTTTDAAALDVDKLSRSLEAQLAGEEEFTIKEDMSVRCSPCALGLRSLLRLTERGGWRRSSRRSTLPTWRTRRCS